MTNEYGDTVTFIRLQPKQHAVLSIYEITIDGKYHRTMAGDKRARAEVNKIRGHRTKFK